MSCLLMTSYRWLTPHALIVHGETTIARARTRVLGDLIVAVASVARPDQVPPAIPPDLIVGAK
jgi:hypothetical protein